MGLNDALANILSAIKNAENRGKSEVVVRPASKLARELLKLLKAEEYVEDFEIIDDKKSGIPIDAFNHLLDPMRYSFEYLIMRRGL